jgi:hypothetical protein
MNADEPAQRLLSDEEKRLAIEAAKRKLAARLGVDPDSMGHKISFGLESDLSPERQWELAKAKGLQWGLASMDELAANIKTEKDLNRFNQLTDKLLTQVPTSARAVLHRIKATLPRGGGPGRTPTLNAQESIKVCDEIAKLIRNGDNITKALKEASKMCPDIVGKEVGTRTLAKVWSKRGELPFE